MKEIACRNPLNKTLKVLGWMVEALPQGGGVREIARDLRMAPSTVYRVLTHMTEEGLVLEEAGKGRYRLGLELLRLAGRAAVRFPISEAVLPIMRELVDACNETALLGLYDPVRMEMFFAATVESPQPLRYAVELNRWIPVYAGATGLTIMAFLPEEERREIVARTGLAAVTQRTITDPARLELELERIRRRGYACTAGQRTPGAVGLTAPIWGPDDRVLGDLTLTFPEHRFDPQSQPELARLLIRFARRATEQLGGRVPC